MRKLLRIVAATAVSSLVGLAGLKMAINNDTYSSCGSGSSLYSYVVSPVISKIDPETGHRLAVLSAKFGMVPRYREVDPPVLRQTCWGRVFSNPVGLAAGFDKDAEAMKGMVEIGFGFVEIGSVCPKSQPGNDKPRVFRSPLDKAVINRYGFNSAGADVVETRLKKWVKNKQSKDSILGINLGKNKTTEDPAEDYLKGVQKLGKYADYLVINVSSPNTPNLRQLQEKDALEDIIRKVKLERDKLEMVEGKSKPPLLIKIAPDLGDFQKENIATVALATSIDGIIISNSTVSRDDLKDAQFAKESGGLTGKPLFDKSTAVLRDIYILTEGKIPLIGTGGIFTGQDALTKIEQGASLVQLYTSMALEGPATPTRIKKELAFLLHQKGYKSVSDAVGKGVKMSMEEV